MRERSVGCSRRNGTLPPERGLCQFECHLDGAARQAYTAPVSRRTQVLLVPARPALVLVLLATAFSMSPYSQEAKAPVTIHPDTLVAHAHMLAGDIGRR